MKLRLNGARDLASVPGLPPQRTRGRGAGASASSSAAAASQQRSRTVPQKCFSRSVGASFSQSQGGRGGGYFFSEDRGAGVAPFSQNTGGGGAAFSQGGGGGGGGAAFSHGGGGGGGGGGAALSRGVGSAPLSHPQPRIPQASLDGNLLTLHRPSPSRHQIFALTDDSCRRMASFPANSASVAREESQLQLAITSSNCNPIHRWNPSLPDRRCETNENFERKLQHLASSVHKIETVLDSVQNDVMQLKRAMKEASLDSHGIQKKFVLAANSVQQILKGQDDLKTVLEGSTKSNPDELSALNYHASKLDEISSTLPVFKQVHADLSELKSDIFRIHTKEMEEIVRAIRSFSSRPDRMQMLAEKPVLNLTLVSKESPQMNERPMADCRPQMKQTPVANGRSQMNQTPVANGRPQMKHGPEANGKPSMKQIPVAKVLPALLVYRRRVKDPKTQVEPGKVVKAAAQNMAGSSCCRVAPKQEKSAIQKVDPQVPTRKGPCSKIIDLEEEEEGIDWTASCVTLKTETGAGGELMREEETSGEALEILRRERKRRRREEDIKDIMLFRQ